MLFIWVSLFVLAFLGAIALVFYLTIELNELVKTTREIADEIKERYGN
ncbi:MAG: hypothetical protein LBB56_06705 [Chitinispirillales bacterium]|jgi:hypothetical protein|nr:hypothetical protein [Chitinispirillales bacterium]